MKDRNGKKVTPKRVRRLGLIKVFYSEEKIRDYRRVNEQVKSYLSRSSKAKRL